MYSPELSFGQDSKSLEDISYKRGCLYKASTVLILIPFIFLLYALPTVFLPKRLSLKLCGKWVFKYQSFDDFYIFISGIYNSSGAYFFNFFFTDGFRLTILSYKYGQYSLALNRACIFPLTKFAVDKTLPCFISS